jgi:glutamyl-tRNA reductase
MSNTPQTPVREEWLTLHDACSLVGVSPATLRRWSDKGDVSTFTTPGGHRRFARSAILGLLPVPRVASGASSHAAADPPAGTDGPLPSLVALVAQARRVPTAAREAFATELAALERSEATIVVHTCQRVELYVALEGFGERPLPEPPPGAQRLEGIEVARHLISVACGLDSAVICENQVLHQLRKTLSRRRTEHPLDPTLDRLFQVALQAGRRARSRVGGSPRSLANVALDCIEEQAGKPKGQRVLIVGAGIMGRLAALAAAREGAEVIVTSRTGLRAVALAREVGGRAIPFEGEGVVPHVAGAIVALNGLWRLGDEDARALAESGAIVVDMSSPAAVPDALQAALGDRFVSADDLARAKDVELQDPLRGQLGHLVAEFADSYFRWLRSRSAGPAIQAIGETADEQRRGELDWLFRRLPGLAEKERSLIEQMSHRLVADILHAPRSALNSDDSGQLAQAARELFGA